uniref:Putative acyltransferase required for palmitoylation of hedgehog hh family of secreted signaling n=1 Tax=Hyalomma excavatum TaxID=257692 RepID=A0A131XJM8_9ACAR
MAEELYEKDPGHQELPPWQRWAARIFHWSVYIAVGTYVVVRYTTSEVNANLPVTLGAALNDTLIKSTYYGVTRYWDLSDREWREGRRFLLSAWPWLLLHSVIGRALGHVRPSVLPGYHVTYSLIFVALVLGWQSACLFIFEHAVFFALSCIGVRTLCYVVGVLMVAHYDLSGYDLLHVVFQAHGRHAYHITTVAFYWSVLRGCSFCLDALMRSEADSDPTAKGGRTCLAEYFKTLAYTLYLPPLYLGPVQNYCDFVASMEKPKPPLTIREVVTVVAGLVRSGAHLLLMDLLCHYFYSAALINAPVLVSRLDTTSLVGLGVILNIMFYMKYRVNYGAAVSCARIEGHTLPAPPKCIARVHLCSHFWRYFDNGLHLWIKRYVYVPISGPERKAARRILGIAVAFACVWVWHSMTTAVTFWAVLSFTGIALEVVAALIKRLDCAKSFEAKHLTPERTRILKAIVGSFHYLLTATACMFYLVDTEMTVMMIKRIILGFSVLPLLATMYCGAYASQDILEWEAKLAAAKVIEPRVDLEGARRIETAVEDDAGDQGAAKGMKSKYVDVP